MTGKRRRKHKTEQTFNEVMFQIHTDDPQVAEFIANILTRSFCTLTGKTVMGKYHMVESPILVEISAGELLTEEHINEIRKRAKNWEGKVILTFLP